MIKRICSLSTKVFPECPTVKKSMRITVKWTKVVASARGCQQ